MVSIVFVALAAIGAWWVVRSLGKSHEKELKRMEAASKKLPVVREIHDEFTLRRSGPPRPGRIPWVMRAALLVGAVLAILIDIGRIVGGAG